MRQAMTFEEAMALVDDELSRLKSAYEGQGLPPPVFGLEARALAVQVAMRAAKRKPPKRAKPTASQR